MAKNIMKYEISEQLLNNIIDYLSKHPYGEVYQLIGTIHKEVSESAHKKQSEENNA